MTTFNSQQEINNYLKRATEIVSWHLMRRSLYGSNYRKLYKVPPLTKTSTANIKFLKVAMRKILGDNLRLRFVKGSRRRHYWRIKILDIYDFVGHGAYRRTGTRHSAVGILRQFNAANANRLWTTDTYLRQCVVSEPDKTLLNGYANLCRRVQEELPSSQQFNFHGLLNSGYFEIYPENGDFFKVYSNIQEQLPRASAIIIQLINTLQAAGRLAAELDRTEREAQEIEAQRREQELRQREQNTRQSTDAEREATATIRAQIEAQVRQQDTREEQRQRLAATITEEEWNGIAAGNSASLQSAFDKVLAIKRGQNASNK